MVSVDTILRDMHDLSKLEDLCRMCGKSQQTVTPIFDETNRYNYYRVIQQHFRDELQVSKSDILPLKMCSKCLKSMMSWHEFYLECLKVEKKFKRLMDKFSLSQDPEKKTSALVNDVEVIEVSVDDNYNFFNENTGDFDISNVNIKESTSFVDNNDFSHFDVLDDANNSDNENNENKTTETTNNHSEPAGGDKKPSLPLQRKIKKNKSTVCRICGKLFTNRGTYLTHLQRAHSSHRIAKTVRKPLPLEKQQEIEQQKQQELEQLRAEYLKKKTASRKQRTYAKAVPDICHICGKTFKHNSSLRNHLKYIHASNPEAVKHPVRPPRMCELCGKLCKGSYFKSHMMKHTNPDSVKCKDCGKVFAYKSTLRSHIKVSHTDDRPFKCTVCSAGFKRADYLRSHIRYKHQDVKLDDLFKCEHCDMVYKTEKYYLIHVKAHADGSCSKPKSVRRRNGGTPIRLSADDPSKFWCEICNLSFKKRNYYLLHERYVHIKKKPYSISENAEGQYKCDECDRRFSSVSGRNYHCKTVHGKEFDMRFNATCDHCGLSFRNRVFYAKHRAKLNGMPTCYLCWKQFTTDDELTKHIDVDHFTDLPFVCEICKVRFVALKNLDHHIRTRHLNDKPFKCDICDHRTTRKDSLEIHIRGTHLGERPYQCEICGKKFSQRNDWRKHGVRHQ